MVTFRWLMPFTNALNVILVDLMIPLKFLLIMIDGFCLLNDVDYLS